MDSSPRSPSKTVLFGVQDVQESAQNQKRIQEDFRSLATDQQSQPWTFDEAIWELGHGAEFKFTATQPQGLLVCKFKPERKAYSKDLTQYMVAAVVSNESFACCLRERTDCKINKVFRTRSHTVLPLYVLSAYMKLAEEALKCDVVWFLQGGMSEVEAYAVPIC